MEIFNKTIHDFGQVEFNSRQQTTFIYLGNEELNSSNFSVGCSCTKPIYYPQTKSLWAELHVNARGVKQSTITVRTKNEGTVTLILKATS